MGEGFIMKKDEATLKSYRRPLPVPRPWSKGFWEGARENKYLIQTCRRCSANIFYPRRFCPECWSEDLDWKEAKGTGKVYTYTVTFSGAEERFSDDYPYVLALVDLDEGIRVMSNIVDCDPKEVKIGMEVKVVFKKISEDFSLPLFRPRNPK
jgi:uncharacterized OB-fold protein